VKVKFLLSLWCDLHRHEIGLFNRGWNLMKRLFKYVAGAAMLFSPLIAHSADLAVKAPPPAPLPVFSWTGFYIGANIGGAWSNNRWTDTVFLTSFNNGNNGVFIGGGQIGGNSRSANSSSAANGTSTGRPTTTTALESLFRALGTSSSPTTIAGSRQ
jgi:hypothetical protein